jgi:hypothetical protein
MPVESRDDHLFLLPIKDSRSIYWYKADVNVGEGLMRTWMKIMAANARIKNTASVKSGCAVSTLLFHILIN